MKKVILILSAVLCVVCVTGSPIPEKTNFDIVIDTDGAIDDMRAISMLLSRPEVNIRGILLSDGSVAPDESYSRIKAVLKTFNADTIPVGTGPEIKGLNPDWRKFNMGIDYEQGPSGKSSLSASVLLEQILRESNNQITLICLGPLTNIKHALEADKSLWNKTDRIIWYGNPLNGTGGDFNYTCDTAAAHYVMKSGIPMAFLSNRQSGGDVFDKELLNICKASDTSLASFLSKVHSQPEANRRLHENHFSWYDELSVFYLLNAELFDTDISKHNVKHRYNRDYNTFALREVYADMITGNYTREQNVVFLKFPVDPGLYKYDVREIMDSAIILYGYEEWKANVMTDEFHGHLGVFSIVGAKMGTKAKEIFGVQNDQLEVLSYAGQITPYSCLNDGIQVSTGATLGMGTISLAKDSTTAPMAIFRFQGKAIKMTLKQEYLDKVNQDINEGIVKFGLADDGYWKLVRRNALRYWLEWDRNEIFNIEEIN